MSARARKRTIVGLRKLIGKHSEASSSSRVVLHVAPVYVARITHPLVSKLFALAVNFAADWSNFCSGNGTLPCQQLHICPHQQRQGRSLHAVPCRLLLRWKPSTAAATALAAAANAVRDELPVIAFWCNPLSFKPHRRMSFDFDDERGAELTAGLFARERARRGYLRLSETQNCFQFIRFLENHAMPKPLDKAEKPKTKRYLSSIVMIHNIEVQGARLIVEYLWPSSSVDQKAGGSHHSVVSLCWKELQKSVALDRSVLEAVWSLTYLKHIVISLERSKKVSRCFSFAFTFFLLTVPLPLPGCSNKRCEASEPSRYGFCAEGGR